MAETKQKAIREGYFEIEEITHPSVFCDCAECRETTYIQGF